MGARGIVCIVRAIEIARQDGYKIAPVLRPVSTRHFNACQLGHGVSAVCAFKRASHQAVFMQRLWGVCGVDAA